MTARSGVRQRNSFPRIIVQITPKLNDQQPDLLKTCSIMLTDISEGMLRDARRAIGDGDEFSFRECFCEALPFADESFDLVLANHVFFTAVM